MTNIMWYLGIGVIVQVCILVLRAILGKTKFYMEVSMDDATVKDWIMFIVTLVLGSIFNIMSWPIAILFEIRNTYYGI